LTLQIWTVIQCPYVWCMIKLYWPKVASRYLIMEKVHISLHSTNSYCLAAVQNVHSRHIHATSVSICFRKITALLHIWIFLLSISSIKPSNYKYVYYQTSNKSQYIYMEEQLTSTVDILPSKLKQNSVIKVLDFFPFFFLLKTIM